MTKAVVIPLVPCRLTAFRFKSLHQVHPKWEHVSVAHEGTYLGLVIGPNGHSKQWKKAIASLVTCKSYVCVIEYIKHMWHHTDNAFAGTKHADDWRIYHDALVLMTAATTKQWMRETPFKDVYYMDLSILPYHGCNYDLAA